VDTLAGTSVWAAPEPGTLLARTADGDSERIDARATVLATGAYDRPVAFPGWTLPGALTAGAAQALAKGQGVVPGRRVLLAGAGPFLLPVATQLTAAGAEVVAVAEATRRADWLRAAPRMTRYPGRLAAYAGYRARMARVRTPVVWGHVIVRADGGDRVRRATIAAAGPDWAPISGTERTFAVDAVCTAYGFLPATELARALGCELREDAVAHDEAMRTSVPAVFVAGEAAGIGGAELARIEGALAGHGAAAAAGRAVPVAEARALRRRRARVAGFARVLDDLFAARPGVLALADAKTPLCRCEDVTAGAIDAAVASGADTLAALKIATRCGQGPCQGRVCERLVAARLPAGPEAERFTVRAPLRPIELPLLMQERGD
jgi:thioredoxin reductase/bacterioferritin-associated ferredoxin